RWVNDGSTVSNKPVGEPNRNPVSKGGLIIDDEGPSLSQALLCQLRGGGAFVELGRDQTKEGIRTARSKAHPESLAVPVRRLLREAFVGGGRAHHGELRHTGNRQLASSEAVVERADHSHDSRI